MNKLKVCVYAICKNELKFVDKWIDSMKEADLIVVTDTGSTDGTVERLRERGAVVYVEDIKPWRFDAARNTSLDHVPDDVDICVCTDLDELFVKGWRKCLENGWAPNAKMGKYLYNWSLNDDGTPNIQFNYFKVHTKSDYRWAYPIHECIKYIGKEPEVIVYIDGMVLNHYPDATKSRGSYLPLLELAVEESPEDDRMRYYLGREYMYSAQWEKSIETLKQHLSLKRATWKEERCASMRWIAFCYHKLSNAKEAYGWYFRAIAELPLMRDPYVECAKMGYDLHDWALVFYMVQEALKIKQRSSVYVNMGYSWDYTLDDLGAISCYQLGMYEKALAHAKEAVHFSQADKRLLNNLQLIENKVNEISHVDECKQAAIDDKLIHTLLFLFREKSLEEDTKIASMCLSSLEKGSYKTVVVCNQGCLTNEQLKEFLSKFKLNCIVIGKGTNTGTVLGRQSCFEYIWANFPNAKFISELHLDMIFTNNWEDPLVSYLENNDEPMVSSGIIDKDGNLNFLETKEANFSQDLNDEITDDFLMKLRCDKVVHGFTNPCIHVSEILKAAGGYNPHFLKGKQCFEDDSMLLGYYYYYGTKSNWYPKVNYNSVVFHAVAGQRLGLGDNVQLNYEGLVKQYGAMGLKHLSQLHKSAWQINYFSQQYNNM